MARPRIFVSSTYYDLKYVRSSLELFVESLGYDAVLSEQGGVAYTPDRALDESCYREVQNCDIYVLIIGGRYGSEASETKAAIPRSFFERYESVTKLEYKAALDKDIPIYIMIERAVYAEYQTFQKNRDNKDVNYAHVDSVNVFHFIEEILAQPSNNPVQPFDKYSEIEEWLRSQWAGLFRDLVQRLSSQQQIATLAAQVAELAEVNKTLRRYLEEVIAKVSPKESARIISSESERLAEANVASKLRKNIYVDYIKDRLGIPLEDIQNALIKADTLDEFAAMIREHPSVTENNNVWLTGIVPPVPGGRALRDLNRARGLVGMPAFTIPATINTELEVNTNES